MPHAQPRIGVGAVVWKGRSVLLIQRGKAPRLGEWSIPGGGQMLGETLREAAEREVMEETGVTIRVGDLIDVVDALFRTDDGNLAHHYTLIDFAADYVEGEAVAGDDAAAVAWVDVDALAQFRLWSETERVIRLSHARRQGGLGRSQTA
jgi:ADP-ribose pyrophosphatase YjhB (NUDIX family)